MTTRLTGLLIIALAGPALPARADAPPPLKQGHELMAACEAFVAAPRARPAPCRDFLIRYMTEFKQAEDERLTAQLSNLPVTYDGPCIRMPDYISFVDLARLVVTKGQSDISLSEGPAETLLETTLEVNFPCRG